MDDPFQITTATVKKEPVITFKELLFKYVRFLPFFIISVSLALLGAFLYLRYTTPIYKSTGSLVVKEDAGSGPGGTGGGDRFQQMFVMDNSINIKNEIEIIKSRPLLKRVVEQLGLNYTYFVKGKIKESNIYRASPIRVEAFEMDSSLSFALEIEVEDRHSFRVKGEGKRISFGQVFENNQGVFRLTNNATASLSNEYKITWQPTDVIVNDITNSLNVAPGPSAGIIQISLESTNPEEAADFINELMEQYQVATREDKNETNRRMIEFIDARLEDVGKELSDITGGILAYQRANNIIDPEGQSSSYIGKIEKTEEEMNEFRIEEDMAITLDAYLRDRKNAYNLVPSTFGLKDGTLGTLIGAYNVAQLERKALIDASVPVANPKVQEVEDRIERLRINALESLRNLKNNVRSSINRLSGVNSRFRSEMGTLPIKEQKLLEMKGRQESKQTVVALLMEKREQTAIALAGTISNMKIIELSRPNNTPVKPNRKNVLLLATIIGLAIPALILFVAELLNDKVNSRQDVEKLTNAPIAGEIGHSFEDTPLVVRPNNRGLVAEQFRIIRSNLNFLLHSIEKPVILITSSFSGEGKSYVSTNLGAVLALASKKTIILEFDIRKPKVLAHLGIPKKPGIINYVMGTARLEDLPVPVPGYENLFVLACGPIPPNPAELLLDPKIDELFTRLKEEYDAIIIDTAPIGMVSDAMTLSRYADNTLYVVRQGHTYKKQISMIEEFYESGKLPRLALLLNDVRIKTAYGYYGYGKYGYGYGDKSGYFDDEMAKSNGLRKWFGWMNGPKKERKKSNV